MKTLLQQALEALELAQDYIDTEAAEKKLAYGDRLMHKQDAIKRDSDATRAVTEALRTAIAQAEQPVAKIVCTETLRLPFMQWVSEEASSRVNNRATTGAD